jgi:Lhr-like helicase
MEADSRMKPDHERLSRESNDDMDEAIEQALEGSERAETWADYVAALEARQKRLERDFELTDDEAERKLLQQKIDEIDEQVQVLREEENITRFVEDTVTFSYELKRLSEG